MDTTMLYGMTFDATVSVGYIKFTFNEINATELMRLLSILPKMTANNYDGREVDAGITIHVCKFGEGNKDGADE